MKCYYAWNTDDHIVEKSSSGGIFTALADYVLSSGGVVFGAYMEPHTYEVSHIQIDSQKDIGKLRGSKYQQSIMADIYSVVENTLKTGRQVLFSGTPCQIAAIYKYISIKKISHEQLLCVEVLCHGVTSNKVVKKYVESKEKQRKSKIRNLCFRTKDRPWYQGSAMKLEYENGKTEVKDNLIDPFYIAYVNNTILRPSCYTCPFAKKEDRTADITIGDFWGAENYIKDKNRLRSGIGLVLTNTDKGEDVWQTLIRERSVTSEMCDFDKAVKRNGALVKPARANPNRTHFFEAITEGREFSDIINSIYRKKIMKNRIKYCIGYDNMRMIKRIRHMLK